MNEIPHWLEKQNDLQPTKVAIEYGEHQSISYSELREESRKLAKGLMKKGVKSGDHVAILSGSRIEFPVCVHALSYVGAVIVCLNMRLSPEELAFQLTDADVTWFIVDPEFVEKGHKAMQSTTLNEDHIVTMDRLPKAEDSIYLNDHLCLDDVFTMMYTSGTTGKPKAVMHTYGNHWFSAVASALNLGLSASDKWLVCLPLFHIGGFSILMKNVIYGMPIRMLDRFDAKVINNGIRHHGVTIVSVVTVMLQRLMKDLQENSYPASFRCVLLGGGPVPKPLLHKASEKSIPVFQTYGMTETSSQIVTLSPSEALRKLGSAGKALAPATLKIFVDGRIAKPYETGEIHVKGPMVSSGYYKKGHQEAEYLATGDAGYLDEEGFLYVVDRVKDMIISGGENIYPAEVESVLIGIEGVEEVAVTGMVDDEWGEVPAAFIVKKEGTDISFEKMATYCRDHLAPYKIPKQLFIISQLPRNASNKIVRRKLFQSVEGEQGHGH
ncbi:o-succinylbenzoate--CoA ligase [Halobacillus shinanisalinarum]|uniref:2-succinylbenzoate--CoA ligase n=1 Tax=Halobacillus shinanisalinarum TaxID=2932258 RepID=A0ABY4H1Z7_9BACI|nr:o-succinylbenzoate--CoA ligase [Halobacillus shinanisalinarum]UOQ94203.1 o-succinylbenzoate--CoA ligase [Halobacillus shinanisalinarum]